MFCRISGFLLGLFLKAETEETFSSETSVNFQRISRRYIAEDRTLLTCFVANLIIVWYGEGVGNYCRTGSSHRAGLCPTKMQTFNRKFNRNKLSSFGYEIRERTNRWIRFQCYDFILCSYFAITRMYLNQEIYFFLERK
jgi:hypothetical protein